MSVVVNENIDKCFEYLVKEFNLKIDLSKNRYNEKYGDSNVILNEEHEKDIYKQYQPYVDLMNVDYINNKLKEYKVFDNNENIHIEHYNFINSLGNEYYIYECFNFLFNKKQIILKFCDWCGVLEKYFSNKSHNYIKKNNRKNLVDLIVKNYLKLSNIEKCEFFSDLYNMYPDIKVWNNNCMDNLKMKFIYEWINTRFNNLTKIRLYM